MVKLPTGSTPAPEADPIPMLTVEEIACPLPAELGTAVIIRVAQFPDGKWRYGYYLSAKWITKKIDKHPMPDGDGFDEREKAIEACMAHCVNVWRQLPAAARIDKTIEWLTAANEPAPVVDPAPVVEPVVEPTAEAATIVTGVDVGTGNSETVVTTYDKSTGEIVSQQAVGESLLTAIPWANGAEFDSLACVQIALRSSVAARFNAELHMGQAGDKFYATTWLEYLKVPTEEWFKSLDLPTDNPRHACVHLTRDSIVGEDPRDVELRAAEALLSLVKPMDVRLAADVGAHVEALRNGVWTKAVRTFYGNVPSTPVESHVAAEAASEATPAIAEAAPETVATETTTAETPVVEPTAEAPKLEPVAEATTSTEEKPDPIAEHARELAETRLEVGELSVEIEELTERRKDLKKRLKEATAELRNLQRWKPQPVRAAETKAEPKPTAATDPTKADEPKPASDAATSTAAAPTSWRDMPFSDLANHGLKPGIIEICSENPKKPIVTLGDWADWNKKYQPTEIARIGAAKADQIADAMEKFWKAHPEFTV